MSRRKIGRFGDFVLFSQLWAPESGEALFPSESSARWFIRAHRDELTQSGSIAQHTGSTYIKLANFRKIVEAAAINGATRRIRKGIPRHTPESTLQDRSMQPLINAAEDRLQDALIRELNELRNAHNVHIRAVEVTIIRTQSLRGRASRHGVSVHLDTKGVA